MDGIESVKCCPRPNLGSLSTHDTTTMTNVNASYVLPLTTMRRYGIFSFSYSVSPRWLSEPPFSILCIAAFALSCSAVNATCPCWQFRSRSQIMGSIRSRSSQIMGPGGEKDNHMVTYRAHLTLKRLTKIKLYMLSHIGRLPD